MKMVIIPTIEEQLQDPARKDSLVDPAGVDLSGEYSLLWGYDYGIPPIGTVKNLRLEDGRVVGDTDLQVGWGGVIEKSHEEDGVTVIDEFRLVHASLERTPAESR